MSCCCFVALEVAGLIAIVIVIVAIVVVLATAAAAAAAFGIVLVAGFTVDATAIVVVA